MAKSANPMEAFRREQKKKELKKHRQERQKEKQGKLAAMDAAELQDQLKNLERQVASNPTDGPTRKRKQELEDTLRAVVKKQKEIAEEERRKQAEAPPPAPLTMTELAEANKERFQNPENSIYYHPTLNPFGAPPPGKPQMYRGVVPSPGSGAMGVVRGPPRGIGRPPPRQGGYPMRQQQQGSRGPPPQFQGGPRGLPRFDERRAPPAPPRPPRAMARRPGKRPPLPPGPPPPGTIQVPPRPPLPSGAMPFRPPPPPPTQKPGDMAPPPPPPRDLNARDEAHPPMTAAAYGVEAGAERVDAEMEEDGVVAPYPTADGETQQYEEQEMDDEAAEEAAESRARLRSLVPVALRVQRRPTVGQKSTVGGPPPAPGPRRPLTVPLAPAPGPAMAAVGPPLGGPPLPPSASTASDSATLTATSDNSVSKEFDAFMEEVKELL